MPTDATPTGELHRTLHAAGWSTGVDTAPTTGGEVRWIVTASKGDRRVEGRGATAAEAWWAALAAIVNSIRD
jgi:hypothetical protein